MFQFSTSQLEALSAEITTREIRQQPELWKEAFDYYKTNIERISAFLNNLPEGRLRVIFAGAGTSQYVGDTILPYLKRTGNEDRFEFQSVGTTNLVSNPHDYFKAEIPTVLVSFARSGNSPESLASVQLGQQIVRDFYQITITCAPEGKLAIAAKDDTNNLLLMMPDRSNDAGFAMTGSFTCMTLTALLVFDEAHSLEEKEGFVKAIRQMGTSVLEREDVIQHYVNLDYNRVIYLGAGPFFGLAHEAQLKILELTAGQVATMYESPVGFRHGPKSLINEDTVVLVFGTTTDYTRKYDLDLVREVAGDRIARRVVLLSDQAFGLENVKEVVLGCGGVLNDVYRVFPYIVYGQLFALLTSLKVGNRPDTPSPTGTVNRVVQGVIIHEFK